MQLWIWRHFRIEVPAAWEMLQFSRNHEKGRCAFADRYQYCLEVSWRQVEGRPDFERMMSDYSAKLAEDGTTKTKNRRYREWHGLETRNDQKATTRFGNHYPEKRCVVELVFLWPGRKDLGLEEKVLDSFGIEPPVNQFERWCAFGMDMYVPKDMPLAECTVLPANADMMFESAKLRVSQRFGRRGMVAEWLNGSVDDWMKTSLVSKAGSVLKQMRRDVRGHSVFLLSGQERSRRLFTRYYRLEAAAWICPRDKRLYSMVDVRHLKNEDTLPAGDMPGKRLQCCSNIAR